MERHLGLRQIHLGIWWDFGINHLPWANTQEPRLIFHPVEKFYFTYFLSSPFACIAPFSTTHHCEAKSAGLDQFHHLSRDVSSAASGRSTKQTKTKTEPLRRLIDRTWRLARSLRRLAPGCPPWGLAEQNTGKNRRASERVQTIPPSEPRVCVLMSGAVGRDRCLAKGARWKYWTTF